VPFTPKYLSSLLFFLIINVTAFALQNDIKIDSLENYLGKASEENKLSTLQTLAKEYYFISFDQARTYANESYGIASRTKNLTGMANSQRLIGNSFLLQDSYDSALVYLNKAHSIYVSIGDKEGAGNVKSSFAKIYMSLGNYQKSLDFLHEVLSVFDKTDKEYEKGLIKNDIGIIYYKLGKYQRSMDYFWEVMAHFKKSNEDINLGGVQNNIGMILTDLKQYDTALTHYELALEEKRKLGNTSSIASTLSNIGQLHHTMGNYQEALIYYNKSLELSTDIGRKMGVGKCYNNIGKTHTMLNNFKKAENFISLGLNVFSKIGVSNVRDSYLAYKELYLEMGDTIAAYSWFNKYVILNDSIFNEESDKRISNLEIVYEAEKKEKEIEVLNAENKLKDHQIGATKKWLIVLGGGLFIIIIISLITIKQKVKLKRANDFLVHKNLEIINSDKILTNFEDERENEEKLVTSGEDNPSQNKYTHSPLLDEQKEDLLIRIKFAFEEEKIYLKNDLTLLFLAEKLNTNKSYLSQVINEYFRKNFSTFVNEYRVKEASRILLEKESKNFTIEAIANSVGFKSKSAFNNAFKKFTGITPSYFVNSTKS